MIEINKTYCRKIYGCFRYATVVKLDLMDDRVFYSIVDKDGDGNVLRTWPNNDSATIKGFTLKYLNDAGICY